MVKVIKYSILFVGFSLSSSNIKIITETDVEIMRLQLLCHIKANCSEGNELMFPLCIAMKAFLERLDVLLQCREMNVTSLVIPVIEKFEGQLDTIKQTIRASDQGIRVAFDENVELREQINSLKKQLEYAQPSDMESICRKLQVLLEKYKSRLKQ